MSLLLVAHGTRDPAGTAMSADLAAAIRRLLAVPVELAFADVREPSVTSVLRDWTVPGPIVAVPAFLAAGYHVRVDLPGQIRGSGRPDVLLTAPVGPRVVPAAMDRLIAAGWRASDAVVLAAAGSSDPRARADVRRAAAALSELVGQPVGVGYLATGRPTVAEAVADARRSGRRVAVASWLLASGLFHQWLARSGADIVSEPIGVHPLLVAQLVQRYLNGSTRLPLGRTRGPAQRRGVRSLNP
jgi:sirohydrochlorin ferrochelatase